MCIHPTKCKGCDTKSISKKGWCSIQCYRKNQTIESNSGRFFKGQSAYNKKYEKILSNCIICNTEFEHVGKSKYCSNSCAIVGRIKIKPTKCSNCNKEIRKKVGKSGFVYCSKLCYNQYRNNNVVKRDDSRKSIKLNCIICDTEYERPPSQSKNSKYCSLQCHSVGNVLNMPKSGTSIEIKIEKLLTELDIPYVKQKVISNKTVCDFFIEPNIVIYADGDYWHSLPDVIIRDNKINNYLKNKGYYIYRYSETIINNNLEIVKNELKQLV
jgi:very-short-patch-repair endonuclease